MADLLIRGASLPKDKEKIFVIFPDGVVNVVERGTPYYEAVEIPDHGDLIDRGKIKNDWFVTTLGTVAVSLADIDGADPIIPASKEGE